MPVWAYVIITLVICIAGGSFICLMFSIGIKHGIDEGFKKLKEKENDQSE